MVYAPALSLPSEPIFSAPSINRLRYSHTRAWQHYEEGLTHFQKPEKRGKHFRETIGFAEKNSKKDAAIFANSIGVKYAEQKLYNEALTFIQRAIELDLDLPETHNNLGILLKKQKKYDEAEREYREAIRLRPNFPEAHYNLGNLLYEQKKHDEAEREYREAIRLRPDFPEAHNNLGVLLREHKRCDEAEVECKRAVELAPNEPVVHNNLGLVLYDKKEYMCSEKEYRKAVELDIESPLAHVNLGVLLSVVNRCDEAKVALGEALRLFGERETERLEEALRYLETVSSEHPESYSLWWARGKFLQALGKDDEARECLETAEAFENLEIPDIEHDIVVRMEPIKTWKTVKARVKYMGPAEPRVAVDLEEDELLVDKD